MSFDALRLLVGTELCDAVYVIEFDFDLDGDTDAGDEAALVAIATPRADLDASGVVEAGDTAQLLAAWGSGMSLNAYEVENEPFCPSF